MERRSHPLHAFRSVALLSCIAVLSSQSQAIADVGITPGGVTHSRDSTYARSVVRITAGGPDCFGVIVTRNILIAPLVACARITPGLQDPVEFQAPDFTGSKRIKAVVAELSEKFGFIILKFEHTLPADAIARELRLADDDSYSHAGDLSSIRALSNKTDPIGSPCVSRTQNDSLIFECDDSQAPIIVGGSHIVAIAKRSGGYALARSIIESSDILKALEPPPSKGIVVSQPDGDDNDEAEQSADNNSLSEKLPSLYEDSQALIVAASEYKGVWSVLPTIPKESDDLAKALIQQGFKVRVYANPRSGMLYPVLKSFLTDSTARSRKLVYFMGHGWSDKEHHGYLVPVDAADPNTDVQKFEDESVSMIEIEGLARQTIALHTLFVFDSCFSGTIFDVRSLPATGDELVLAEAIKPVRQFLSAGTDDQSVPSESVFTPTFIRGIKGDADRGARYIAASKLASWLKAKIAPMGIQTPRLGAIADPRLNVGDFLFFPPSKVSVENGAKKE